MLQQSRSLTRCKFGMMNEHGRGISIFETGTAISISVSLSRYLDCGFSTNWQDSSEQQSWGQSPAESEHWGHIPGWGRPGGGDPGPGPRYEGQHMMCSLTPRPGIRSVLVIRGNNPLMAALDNVMVWGRVSSGGRVRCLMVTREVMERWGRGSVSGSIPSVSTHRDTVPHSLTRPAPGSRPRHIIHK